MCGMPQWFHWLSIAFIALAIACAAVLLVDIIRRPQRMGIMNVVWPVCALFGSVGILGLYFRYGRLTARDAPSEPSDRIPQRISIVKGALHCGSGCTLGDIVAETVALAFPPVLIAFGWNSLFRTRLWSVWIFDLVLAWLFGVAFQYFTIAPMRNLSLGAGLKAAVKADTLSVLSWQIGMYAVMACAQLLLFPAWIGTQAKADTPEFWFAMQVAMIAGLATSYPMNAWLIRIGWKEKM
jgi:hypothetical protein